MSKPSQHISHLKAPVLTGRKSLFMVQVDVDGHVQSLLSNVWFLWLSGFAIFFDSEGIRLR